MTPADQEFTHDPANGQHGDCMRACIASLLDLPIAAVPHFAQLAAEGKGEFWPDVTEFCRQYGYSFVILRGEYVWSEDPVFHIIAGASPRMAVVFRRLRIVPSVPAIGSELMYSAA